jgi:2-(1,2-epoxy-1,2-dihydrophenyl)acetyl-CoA isomerase
MAAGAGFPLAAAADVVLAGRSARFTLGYTRIGFSVDGGTSLLVHSLGLHRALRLALLNDVLTAEELYAAGLLARVVDDEDLPATVEQVVAQLASGPAAAQAATKRLLRTAAEEAPESALRAEALSIRERAAEPDGREGVRAFLEKRSPRF